MHLTDTPQLWAFEQEAKPAYGDPPEVLAVRGLIADITDKGHMTPAKQVLTITAVALAQNIAKGNVKGRSIANEAAQLAAIVEQLTAETGDAAGMTEETKELIRALTIDPQAHARPEEGDTAEP